jgi:valyl-tRNA synthetase
VAIVDNFKLMLNIKIDKKLELARLEKEIDRLEAEIHKASGKLENKNFINKAPEEVISQEKERLLEFTQLNEKVKAQLVKLKT